MIAWFAETFPEAHAQAHDPEREELQGLVRARQDLLDMQTQLANRGEHDVPAAALRAQAAITKTVARELAKLEAAIAATLKQTPRFAEDAAIITSVPGLASIAAAAYIARLPELGMVSSKVIAALIGSAPYDDDSGGYSGVRHIRGGRADLRAMIYMAVVGAATRHNPVLKDFYLRLRAKGKVGKVAIIACMRKLTVILNTMIARREKWDPSKHAVA